MPASSWGPETRFPQSCSGLPELSGHRHRRNRESFASHCRGTGSGLLVWFSDQTSTRYYCQFSLSLKKKYNLDEEQSAYLLTEISDMRARAE